MAKVDGSDVAVPKLRTGWEHWGKLNWETKLKPEFDTLVIERGLLKGQLANARNAYKKAQFELLSPEEQAHHEETALAVHTDAKEAKEKRKSAPVLLSPHDAQK